MGLAKEAAVWKSGEDPLLYLERKAYSNAMLNALAGLEEARVAPGQGGDAVGGRPALTEGRDGVCLWAAWSYA